MTLNEINPFKVFLCRGFCCSKKQTHDIRIPTILPTLHSIMSYKVGNTLFKGAQSHIDLKYNYWILNFNR